MTLPYSGYAHKRSFISCSVNLTSFFHHPRSGYHNSTLHTPLSTLQTPEIFPAQLRENILDCGVKFHYNNLSYGNFYLKKGFLSMAKEFKITSLRLADLEKELNYLKTTREREVAAMIAEARSYGDLSENSEYDAAKNEQAKLYGRIAEIEDILSHAVIIEDENEASGRVGLGCTVLVEDEKGVQTEYRITGSQEANPMEHKLSDDSPFGRSVVGKAAGETFTVNAPAGSFTMKVVRVTREG